MTCLKTPEQAAEYLQCSPKQVHAHAKSGELFGTLILDVAVSARIANSLRQTLLTLPNAEHAETPTCLLYQTPKGSPYYHFDFQMRGSGFFGSTKCSDRRQAEAVERSERGKAQAVSRE